MAYRAPEKASDQRQVNLEFPIGLQLMLHERDTVKVEVVLKRVIFPLFFISEQRLFIGKFILIN